MQANDARAARPRLGLLRLLPVHGILSWSDRLFLAYLTVSVRVRLRFLRQSGRNDEVMIRLQLYGTMPKRTAKRRRKRTNDLSHQGLDRKLPPPYDLLWAWLVEEGYHPRFRRVDPVPFPIGCIVRQYAIIVTA